MATPTPDTSQTTSTVKPAATPGAVVPDKLGFIDRLWHKRFGRPYLLHFSDHGGPLRGGAPDPGAPVIIMLHGLASSSANWDPLIPLLTQRYRCITIDLVGFGDSPKPQWYDYTMEQHLKCLQHTISHLRLKAPFTLLGHSLGSLLATRYARHHQANVNRLILLSPPVYETSLIKKRSAQRRTSLYLKAYNFISSHRRVTYENFARLSRILPIMRFLILDQVTWKPFVRSLKQCIENQTLISDIKVVTAPTDIFYGLYDEVVVPYNVRQLGTIRDVRLYPLRVNHMVGSRYASAAARHLNSL